jgi:hypothetical protein
LEIAAGLGFAGGIASQAISDYQTGALTQRSFGQNLATYGVAGTEGAFIAGGTVVAGLGAAALDFSAAATAVTVGARPNIRWQCLPGPAN